MNSTRLFRRHDLIPYKDTAGQQMRFRRWEEIFVLSPDRAFASIGDGDIYGWLFLRYEVAGDGEITWKILESYCPYYDK